MFNENLRRLLDEIQQLGAPINRNYLSPKCVSRCASAYHPRSPGRPAPPPAEIRDLEIPTSHGALVGKLYRPKTLIATLTSARDPDCYLLDLPCHAAAALDLYASPHE